MPTFTYTHADGEAQVVEAAYVTFEPTGHVVFRTHSGRIAIGEQGPDVNGLREKATPTR